MKKSLFIFLSCLACTSLMAAGHPRTNTEVDCSYTQVGKGEDSELFLNPILESELKNISGELVLDAGCGAAPWMIAAAKNGARVSAAAIQKKMMEQALFAAHEAGLEKEITVTQSEISNLPYENNFFDKVVSINVGCALPATTQIITDQEFSVIGLGGHYRELTRVLKSGGHAVIVAPASFGIVFTSGMDSEKSEKHIQQALAKIGKSENPDVIIKNLEVLSEVNRAAFVRRAGRLTLITNEKDLQNGEAIWLKVPGGVVSSYYHSEEEYLVALDNAGLTCEEIKRPRFFSKVKWDMYRSSLKEGASGLSQAYIEHHPFTVYYVAKKA